MPNTYLLENNGQCIDWPDLPAPPPIDRQYRLYRFLTEIEDILIATPEPEAQLKQIIPRVQQLLEQSPWLFFDPLQPDPEKGWEVQMLYDEPEFPLTVQIVAWEPGSQSPIHNHGAWGIVAMLQGEEKNTFWQRSATSEHPHRITQIGHQNLACGDIIGILPDAIHHITALGDQPTVSFNLYGATDYNARYEFDPHQHTAQIF
ncbi:cupin [filamentous cyanobacterium LEGE 11480]|uniref:Cupin n=1 Tax=Romeriopsis navalis LEGE 11480 TaxID=2777977 RepID=A0A928Z0S8_9CYAN|nr:cupin [Romeriopsis navalis]MBE9028591.1 cupin [Romeriopsis navalis LEGE 11480]